MKAPRQSRRPRDLLAVVANVITVATFLAYLAFGAEVTNNAAPTGITSCGDPWYIVYLAAIVLMRTGWPLLKRWLKLNGCRGRLAVVVCIVVFFCAFWWLATVCGQPQSPFLRWLLGWLIYALTGQPPEVGGA